MAKLIEKENIAVHEEHLILISNYTTTFIHLGY